jgi:hypothetical protein
MRLVITSKGKKVRIPTSVKEITGRQKHILALMPGRHPPVEGRDDQKKGEEG